jgi:hypothetical protein
MKTYSHKFTYYKFPIKSVKDQPIAVLHLQNINLLNIMKIDDKSKIAIVVKEMLKKKTSKFYILNI